MCFSFNKQILGVRAIIYSRDLKKLIGPGLRHYGGRTGGGQINAYN